MSSSPLHRPAPHESAVAHVTGTAVYVDDLCPPGTLHAVLVPSPVAHGHLRGVDVAPALAEPGVVRVLTAADIPGDPLIGAIVHDEPLLAGATVCFRGQAVAMVLGETREAARRAAARVRVEVDPLPALLRLDDAIAAGAALVTPHVIRRGDVDGALARLPGEGGVVVEGEVHTGGQDHFYLETHAALAWVDEGDTLQVLSSTQHPTEIQRMVARVLAIGEHRVVCAVPRMGGGFGGKESQATAFAALAALGAWHVRRPVKVWLSREEDMAWTGGRHPFRGRYRAGFDREGRFVAFDVRLDADGGWSTDLTGPILDRALFHLDNACYLPHVRFEGHAWRTHTVSRTAFRGFGGPQGMVVAADAVRRGARALGLPPETVWRRSYYGVPRPDGDRAEIAPYGAPVEAPRLAAMHDSLVAEVDLPARRAAVAAWNARGGATRRGLGLHPVKFGISFTNTLLNQAGALVLVYADGTVQVNHGGTEMGQGLHTKVAAVAADALGVERAAVRVMRTSTDKVPNTSATAASTGADLNGAAVREACLTVRARMAAVAAGLLGAPADGLAWAGGRVTAPDGRSVAFAEVAKRAWLERVSLASAGFYATPGIAYDRARGEGRPFAYYAYGVAVVEVEVNGYTGEHRVRAVDILHDVGDSLVPSVDRGQIEGAFVQGLGWLTTEEIQLGPDGEVRTLGPSTYKVPAVGDVPRELRVRMLEGATQPGVVGGSKAVGEPPFMLAIAVLPALEEAIAAFGPGPFTLSLPATGEAILRAVTDARGATAPPLRSPR